MSSRQSALRRLAVVGALAVLLAGVLILLLPPGQAGTEVPQLQGAATELKPSRTPVPREDSPLSLVGELRLTRDDDIADLAAYEDLALLGVYCGGSSGAHIVDISKPQKPVKLAETPAHVNTSAEDLEAVRIGARDVLALGLQNCRRRSPGGDPEEDGLTGLELVDISDPRRPRSLSIFETELGVHELDVVQHPGGQTLALLAVPRLEQQTSRLEGGEGTGDLLIVDISDPRQPRQIAEWGLLDAPELGPEVFQASLRGQYFDVMLHSARGSVDGRFAYLSYWDAGVIILDLADPAAPRYVSRIPYADGDEGNAHSVSASVDGATLVVADEDFSPYTLDLHSSALAAPAPALGLAATSSAEDFSAHPLSGRLFDAGQLCEEPEELKLTGRIALVEGGECGIGTKIALAQKLGAKGVVIYHASDQRAAPYEEMYDIEPGLEVELPREGRLRLMIPALFIQRDAGLQLLAQSDTATVETEVRFDGYSGLHLYDISDPAEPHLLSEFTTPNARSKKAAGKGVWTPHNPEIVGQTVVASWYSDGVWAIDISDPANPGALASWDGDGRKVFIWGVVPHGDMVLASDMGFGLYVLRA